MNDLKRIDTLDNGNALLFYPSNGVLFYFEKIDYDRIRLYSVDVLSGTETDCDEFSTFDELPNPVRAAIVRSPYRMRDKKTTLEGAMS